MDKLFSALPDNIKRILYADDLAVPISSKHSISTIVSQVNQCILPGGLSINHDKCIVLAHWLTHLVDLPSNISRTHKTVKYIGFKLNYSGMDWVATCEDKRSEAKREAAIFAKMGCYPGGIDIKIQEIVFKCFIKSKFEFGLGLCHPDNIPEVAQVKLKTLWRTLVKQFSGTRQWVPTTVFNSLFKEYDVMQRIQILYDKQQTNSRLLRMVHNGTIDLHKLTSNQYVQPMKIKLDLSKNRAAARDTFGKVGSICSKAKYCPVCGISGAIFNPLHLIQCIIQKKFTDNDDFTPKEHQNIEKISPFAIKEEYHDNLHCNIPGLRIYTDASRSVAQKQNGYSAIFVTADYINHFEYSSPYDYDITRLELLAICTAILLCKQQRLDNKHDRISIFTDSKSALRIVTQFKNHQVPHPCTWTHFDVLLPIQQYLPKVQIYKVKAHDNILFNEEADHYANVARIQQKQQLSPIERVIKVPKMRKKDNVKSTLSKCLKLSALKYLSMSSSSDDQGIRIEWKTVQKTVAEEVEHYLDLIE